MNQIFGQVSPSDINSSLPSASASKSEKHCILGNIPPGYASIMQCDSEEALINKIEEQYGSLTFYGYIKTGIVLLVGTVGCLMMMVICIGIPPAMVVMGSLYLHKCPAQPYIPIYLIVGGIFSLLSLIFGITIRIRFNKKTDQPAQSFDMALLGISNLIHCFTIAWFISGCMWVYGLYEPSYDETQVSKFCDKTVYLFSFWLLNSVYIVIGSLLILGFLMLICSLIFGDRIEKRIA